MSPPSKTILRWSLASDTQASLIVCLLHTSDVEGWAGLPMATGLKEFLYLGTYGSNAFLA